MMTMMTVMTVMNRLRTARKRMGARACSDTATGLPAVGARWEASVRAEGTAVWVEVAWAEQQQQQQACSKCLAAVWLQVRRCLWRRKTREKMRRCCTSGRRAGCTSGSFRSISRCMPTASKRAALQVAALDSTLCVTRLRHVPPPTCPKPQRRSCFALCRVRARSESILSLHAHAASCAPRVLGDKLPCVYMRCS